MFDPKVLNGRYFLATPEAIREAVARLSVFPSCPSAREVVEERQRRCEEARQAASKAIRATRGKIGVIGIYGVVEQRMSSALMKLGGTSTEEVGIALDAMLADSTVDAIVLDVDSPGGSVYGVEELSDKIYNARGKKKIYAIANSLAASAGYWLLSAAEVVAVTPGGDVGSVGVYAVHVDESKAIEAEGLSVSIVSAGKYKVEFANTGPLTPEAKAYLQDQVNDTYSKFLNALKRNRGVSLDTVRRDFGEGRVLGADKALAAKMVDKVMTFDELLGRLTGNAADGKRASVEVLRLRQARRKQSED